MMRNALVWGVCLASVYKACGGVNYAFCGSPEARKKAFCDESLGIEARLDALVDPLSLEDKVRLITPNSTLGNVCDTSTGGIDALGGAKYMWLTEANSNIAGRCVAEDRCATTFVGPLGIAASFNRTSFQNKGRVISTEARAMRNVGGVRTVGREELVGLTGYGPNINIVRDPRFGRNSELASEDPFLSGVVGGEMITGMQERDADGRPRMAALLKHLSVYSKEENREHSDITVSMFDLFDTYMRQYEIAATLGAPSGAMCSYTSLNGTPLCANKFILDKVFRGRFHLPDALISSDCDAINALRGEPLKAASDAIAAAFAINNGTDVEMGSQLFYHLPEAVKKGYTTEATITRTVKRALRWLFRLGLFDTFGKSEFDALDANDLNSTWAQKIAYESALQAPVLLQNRNGVLPLASGSTGSLALVGPYSTETIGLYSDYAMNADPCFDPKNKFPVEVNASCIHSLAQAISRHKSHKEFSVHPGIPVEGTWKKTMVDRAVQAAKSAHVVVLALGIGKAQEQEGKDRKSTELPAPQVKFAKAILDVGKPTVIILFNGGQLALDWIPLKRPDLAVVEAFNPNRDGTLALADLLFGVENRWGKLPYTIYPSDFTAKVAMDSFDMSKAPGRTYRYYTEKALWPFGFGMSYTQFHLSCDKACIEKRNKLWCNVTNTGTREGDEVIQFYHQTGKWLRDHLRGVHPVPLKSLVDFRRITIPAGGMKRVGFDLTEEKFLLTDAEGKRRAVAGDHELIVSLGTRGGSADPGAHVCEYQVLDSQLDQVAEMA